MDSPMMDGAAGVLLGQACGDALGVPFEFGPALRDDFQPEMLGGGPFGFAPGEYSDDTSMAVCIARVASTGADLTSDDALDQIADNFMTWARTARDVGSQTRAVLSAARGMFGPPGLNATRAAAMHNAANPNAEGNGGLMRTAIVALSRPDDREATAAAASKIAALTHAGDLSVDSAILWTEAVRVAVTEHRLDLANGLDLIDTQRQKQWRSWIEEATNVDPRVFGKNGYTVWALQAAWAAITWTSVPESEPKAGRYPAQHFELALKNAVRAGDDADTVAAIAGGLLGAFWGLSAIPHYWTRKVHGYGDCRAHDLVALAALTASAGLSDERGWPDAPRMDYGPLSARVRVPHPHDPGVMLGSYASLADHECDAVVSLCRIGPDDLHGADGVSKGDHIQIRLIDNEHPDENPHLEFVLHDAAQAIKTLRDEGKTVFLHCVRAEQRTPAVALVYSRLLGIDSQSAQADIRTALPSASGRGLLWETAVALPAAPL